MGNVNITHKLSAVQTKKFLASPSGNLAKDLLRRGKRVESGAKRRVRVRTGHLRRSVTTVLIVRNGYPGVAVGSNLSYAKIHHDGRGPVVAKRAKALRFKPRGSRKFIYAKRVKGVKANPFLRDSLYLARG